MLWQKTACEVIDLLHNREISGHDLVDSVEARIKQVDGSINALPTLCFDRAREQLAQSESRPYSERGPLYGLPVTIKDLTAVQGVRTTSGSKLYQDFVPAQSDQLVRKIENSGGLVFAKSNTPEFGTGGITFNDVFGLTRTPRNTGFASGGSSGGAAASLASGCAWLSHGSDMAGSLRTPAGFCGVTSLRPCAGRIRSDSEYLPYSVLGAEGPMARNIADLGLFADAMFAQPGASLSAAATTPVTPRHVAFSTDLGITSIDDDVAEVFTAFIDSLRRVGIEAVDAAPNLSGVHGAFDVLRAHEYAISLEQTLNNYPGVMKPEVQWNIEQGLALSADDLRQAKRTQGRIINDAARFMDDFDLLICPATSVSSVNAELRYPGSDGDVAIPEYYRWLGIAYATTMTSLPIITLPCGVTKSGMPVGVQLVGKLWGEEKLLQYARAIEAMVDWDSSPIDPINP